MIFKKIETTFLKDQIKRSLKENVGSDKTRLFKHEYISNKPIIGYVLDTFFLVKVAIENPDPFQINFYGWIISKKNKTLVTGFYFIDIGVFIFYAAFGAIVLPLSMINLDRFSIIIIAIYILFILSSLPGALKDMVVINKFLYKISRGDYIE